MFISVYHRLSDTFDVQLAVSRDGRLWTRPERKPIIGLGPAGSSEEGMIFPLSHPVGPIPSGQDQWSVAYNRTPWPHKNRAMRDQTVAGERHFLRWATWQRDRLVALEAREEGTATMVAQTCCGEPLKINYRTFPGGYVRAELIDCDTVGYDSAYYGRDRNMEPLQDYSLDDCSPLSSDDLGATVAWKGNADLSFLRHKKVVVRFQLCWAQLFAMAL